MGLRVWITTEALMGMVLTWRSDSQPNYSTTATAVALRAEPATVTTPRMLMG
jgi:hypothetical protein